jgi:hypothetical protein
MGLSTNRDEKGRIQNPNLKFQTSPHSKHQTDVAGPEKMARETSIAGQLDLGAWSLFGF